MSCSGHRPPLPFCPGCFASHVGAPPPGCEAGDEIERLAHEHGEVSFWGLALGSEDEVVGVTLEPSEAWHWHSPGDGRFSVPLSAKPRAPEARAEVPHETKQGLPQRR